MKDQLYLLQPGFYNVSIGPLYRGDSVPVEGMLSFFPQLREILDVHYLQFAKPRQTLVEALGDAFQSLPVLILAKDRIVSNGLSEPSVSKDNRFIADEKMIRHYLSLQYNLPKAG